MSGGAVVMAYACYRFFTSKSEKESAYFDWVGHIFLFVTVIALLPMPFAGYWLMRSVYSFSQSMGVTMMGGLLTWLFVVQAILIGVLFLGVNFYLWQSMARLKGGTVSALLPSAALGIYGGPVCVADAAHRLYVGQ